MMEAFEASVKGEQITDSLKLIQFIVMKRSVLGHIKSSIWIN